MLARRNDPAHPEFPTVVLAEVSVLAINLSILLSHYIRGSPHLVRAIPHGFE